MKEARLAATGSHGEVREFRADADFAVTGLSAQAAVRGGAVFVGYGLTNEQRHYDSYVAGGKPAAKDALRGKVAICWRFEPMTAPGQSAWGSGGTWKSAQLTNKAALAVAHGAAALLFVNPPAMEKAGMAPAFLGMVPGASIPVVQITPGTLKAIFAQAGRGGDDELLKRLQKDADEGRTGLQPLEEVTISLDVKLETRRLLIHNVAARLPDADAGRSVPGDRRAL